jgi:hypothetical protein
MYRGQDYDEDDHIFRDVSYLRTLNITVRKLGWRPIGRIGPDPYYNWEQLEDPSFGLYVSKCVCKGANGAVTKWESIRLQKLNYGY